MREINSADPTGESHANEMGEALRLHLANLATLGQAESVIVARRMSLKIKQRKPIVDAQSQLFELGRQRLCRVTASGAVTRKSQILVAQWE
ncbi:hypothetical protein, partial [Sinorhizobium medicae]|uniref:hypothetical protein n=1 Tax=Sinorhizobium medicae TaxID=110321 RepID=UPI0023560D7E